MTTQLDITRPTPPPKTASKLSRAPRRLTSRAAILGMVVLLVGGVTAYWLTRGEPPQHYTTVPVSRGTVMRTVTATGTVNPVLTIIVGTYVSGVIQQLYCDYNTEVKAGQTCAQIDPRPYQMTVDQNQANLELARAQLVKDEANLAYTKINYSRMSRLVKMDGSASQDAVDLAKNAYDQAQAQVAVDRATIDQRQAVLEAAQINLGYTKITSPVDGVVVSRNVTMGQTVAASFQTPTLFLIATDLTNMQVDTNVSESDIGGIKVGNDASFSIEAFPNRSFTGRVVQVRQAPQTVQNVVTYDVVVSVANPDLVLKPGMTATTRIVTNRRDDVLRVPNQALRFSPSGLADAGARPRGSAQVFVLRDDEPVAVAAKLGLDDETNSELAESTLKEGDRVITGIQRDSSAQASRPRLFRLF